MTLRIKESEPLETALRRLSVECIDVALQSLDGNEGRDVMIHTVRKQLKQLRALLRLFRGGLGDEYGRELRNFRDLARGLSAARDGAVALDVHAALLNRFGARLYASVGAEVRQLLIRDLQASQRTGHYSRQAHDNDRLRAQLLAARIRCRRWTLKQGAENVLECGIGKTYRRGRKTAREACESRATEDLHELRKQAKLFWHQLEFVASRWPHLALRRTAQVRKLTQLLGDVQDLVVYCLAIERAAGAQSPQAVEILQALAERSRRDLEARALDLAQLVYADKRGELLADLRQADTRRESQSA